MRSLYYLFTLCLVLSLAYSVPTTAAEKAASQTAVASVDDAIPAVPENGTVEDYKDYINTLKAEFQEKVQSAIIQAQKDGINPRSEEGSNVLKGIAKKYFSRIDQALDKAIFLKDVSDDDLEEMIQLKEKHPEQIYRISEMKTENFGNIIDSSSRIGYYIFTPEK